MKTSHLLSIQDRVGRTDLRSNKSGLVCTASSRPDRLHSKTLPQKKKKIVAGEWF